MFVHVFGAYFGMAVSFAFGIKDKPKEHNLEGSTYQSDLFAMIGKIFSFILNHLIYLNEWQHDTKVSRRLIIFELFKNDKFVVFLHALIFFCNWVFEKKNREIVNWLLASKLWTVVLEMFFLCRYNFSLALLAFLQ